MGQEAIKEQKDSTHKSSNIHTADHSQIYGNMADLYSTRGYGTNVIQSMYGYKQGYGIQTKATPIENKVAVQKASTPPQPTTKAQLKEATEPLQELSLGDHIQKKLSIGSPDDNYEKEADQIADQVVRTPEPAVQRKCTHCQQEENEEALQRKESNAATPEVSDNVTQTLQSSGQPMEKSTRSFMENRFGHDFSGVNIHNDSQANQSAKDINALAYTHQNNIVFGAGQYQPETDSGKKLLAHELTHVVQQQAIVPNKIQRDDDDESDQGPAVEWVIPGSSDPNVLYKEMSGYLKSKFKGKPQAEQLKNGLYLILSGKLFCIDGRGKQLAAFPIQKNITIPVSEGYYFADKATNGIYKRFFQNYDTGNYGLQYETRLPSETTYVDQWVEPSSVEKIRELIGKSWTYYMLIVAPIPETTETKTSKQTTPDWGKAKLKKAMTSIRKASATRSTDPTQTDAKKSKAGSKEIPDQLDPWKTDERGIHVFIRVGNAKVSILVKEGEKDEDLEKRIKQKTKELNDSRDPSLSTKVADGAKKTDFIPPSKDSKDKQESPESGKVADPTEEQLKVENAKKIANIPAFPSRIENFGNDITVIGGNNRMNMILDYSIAGPILVNQVMANLEGMEFRYLWEIFDVTNVKTKQDTAKAESSAAGSGESPDSGEATELKRDFNNIGEDIYADLDEMSEDPAVWAVRSNELSLMAISSVVRGVGTLISSFISVITKPRNEKNIGWDREGDFIVRCIATHPFNEDDKYIRASSIAVQPIRVKNIKNRAVDELNRPDQLLERWKKLLETLPPGKEYDQLLEKIKALEASLSQSAMDVVNNQAKGLEAQLGVVKEIITWLPTGKPLSELSVSARLLRVSLELKGINIYELQRNLEEQLATQKKTQKFGERHSKEMKTTYRPKVVLASEENGKVFNMNIMLGEKQNSTEAHPRYRLVDLTSHNTQDSYDGDSAQPGVEGHSKAIENAFIAFRENNGYGRGTIAIKLPDGMPPQGVKVPSLMRSAPGRDKRTMQRLADLAKAAEVAALVIGGPAGMAIGIAGGLAGVAVSIDNMARRYHAGRFEWNFETIMDISSIIGGVAPIGGFIKQLKNGAHVIGLAQMGMSAIVIPVELYSQLQAIDNDKTSDVSPGERQARKAEAILGAVKSGIITFASAHQMAEIGENPSDHLMVPDSEGIPADRSNSKPTQDTVPADHAKDSTKPVTEEKPKVNPDYEAAKQVSDEGKVKIEQEPGKATPDQQTTKPKDLGTENGKPVLAEKPTYDGHKVKVTNDGILVCSHCNLIERRYAEELANPGKDPAIEKIKEDLKLAKEAETSADSIVDADDKAKAGVEITQRLDEITQRLAEVRNDKLKEMQKRFPFSNDTLTHLSNSQAKPSSVEKLFKARIPEENIVIYSAFNHGTDIPGIGIDIMAGLIVAKVPQHIAEIVLTYADNNQLLSGVNSLVSEGHLKNPSKLRDMMTKINSGDLGARNEFDRAVERAAKGQRIELETQGDLVVTKPDSQEVLQIKNITSEDVRAFDSNLYEAHLQLQGLSKDGNPKSKEGPKKDFTRVADINIANEKNPLHAADRETLSKAIKESLGENKVKSVSPVKDVIEDKPVVERVIIRNKNGELPPFEAPDFK